MTDTTTDTEPAPAAAAEEAQGRGLSDSEIACLLYHTRRVTFAQYDCWRRSRAGESFYSMRRDYPNETRGTTFSAMTLWRWVERVNAAVEDWRIAEGQDRQRSPFGISVADGHSVRLAGDPTPTGRVSTERSSWDAERLAIMGEVDRHSRKRR